MWDEKDMVDHWDEKDNNNFSELVNGVALKAAMDMDKLILEGMKPQQTHEERRLTETAAILSRNYGFTIEEAESIIKSVLTVFEPEPLSKAMRDRLEQEIMKYDPMKQVEKDNQEPFYKGLQKKRHWR